MDATTYPLTFSYHLVFSIIAAIFFLFQFTLLHLDSRNLGKIMIGLLYTYIGLVLFLTGVNIGFSALGAELGAALSSGKSVW